jgi:chromosome partitioning protein
MARVLCVTTQKGGVGKTTTVVNLAYELTKKGKKVLVLDFDNQHDTTKFFASRTNKDQNFYIGDVLLDRKFDIKKAIYPAVIANQKVDNLYLIKGGNNNVMTKLAMDMNSLPKREERLSMHLGTISDDFDFIIIDTAPTANVLLMNAVIAANEFIFPTEFKEHSFDGIENIIEHICEVTFSDEEEIDFLVVPTKINKSSKRALTYGREYCAERFPENTALTTIWLREPISDAERVHKPISLFSPSHEAAMFYKKLSKEVLQNVIA